MFRILGSTTVLILISCLNLVSATCYGPNACLDGWVWRQAIPTDYVCVTPAVRTQTAEDNAAAASRRSPNGGAYGPDTCKNGYVWREAYPNDVVCVLPATRTEAATDNAQAPNRVASLNIWVNDWYPGPDTYPYIKVNGDHFDYGSVQVAIFDSRDNLVQGWTTVTAAPQSGYVGGAWGWESTINDCAADDPAKTTDGYVWAQDTFRGAIPRSFLWTFAIIFDGLLFMYLATLGSMAGSVKFDFLLPQNIFLASLETFLFRLGNK